MSFSVNSSVLTDGLVAYFDVLNPKSYSTFQNSNPTKKWKDLISLNNTNYDLVGTVAGTGYSEPILSVDVGEGITIKCIKTFSVGNGASFLKANFGASPSKNIRTFSFWVKSLYNGSSNQGSIPYFFQASSNVADTFINSSGFGTGLDGTDSYYNGIWFGNNDLFAQELLFTGSLVNTWKNITLVFPSTLTVSSFSLFGNVGGSSTSGMSYAISQILAYSRALSIEEIAANYFAFKGRYGI
ncbi:MAG: hypothetical protein EBX50_09435 [Chitinophagia bacterium]|nr:hypothetical protein [Chitinophagia bacterium]